MQVTSSQRWLLILGETSLVLVAYIGGRWAGVDPLAQLSLDPLAAIYGVLATLPMLLVFWLAASGRWPLSTSIRQAVDELLAPFFARWPVWQLALVAAAAGIGEELLFRGVLQDAVAERYGWPAGLAVASLLFGVVHFLTAEYALYATLVGAYLGVLYLITGDLLAPIVAHGLYDLAALVYVGRYWTTHPVDAEAV